MKKALVCMAAFKGFLTNRQTTQVVAESLRELSFQVTELPIGDGGAGSFYSIVTILGGEFLEIPSVNPLGQKIISKVLLCPSVKNPKTLFIESSETCGYTLISTAERDALRASSQGLGIVLREVFERYEKKLITVYVGLGDSAISDGGQGMLDALKGRGVPKNHTLRILCDVENPLCGPEGSARVFAPQKGASPDQVVVIEKRLENFAKDILKTYGRSVEQTKFCGSAGGLAAGFYGALGAELLPGAQTLLSLCHFHEYLHACDFLVTGEGKTDRQTLKGKAPQACIEAAARTGKASYLFSGILGEGWEELKKNRGFQGATACGKEPSALDALRRAVKQFPAFQRPGT